jgi:hypothetical protein
MRVQESSKKRCPHPSIDKVALQQASATGVMPHRLTTRGG